MGHRQGEWGAGSGPWGGELRGEEWAIGGGVGWGEEWGESVGGRGTGRAAPEVGDAAGRADASPHHDHHPLAGPGSNQLGHVLQGELLLRTVASVSRDTGDSRSKTGGRPSACRTDSKGRGRAAIKSRQVVQSEPPAPPPPAELATRPSCPQCPPFPAGMSPGLTLKAVLLRAKPFPRVGAVREECHRPGWGGPAPGPPPLWAAARSAEPSH